MVFRKKNISFKNKTKVNNTKKNVRFKYKAKQMVEQHRKQTLVEKSYQKHGSNDGSLEAKVLQFAANIDNSQENEPDVFEELLNTLHSTDADMRVPMDSSESLNEYGVEKEKGAKIIESQEISLKNVTYSENGQDYFSMHLNYDLPVECVDGLWSEDSQPTKSNVCWPCLGSIKLEIPAFNNIADAEQNIAKNTQPSNLHGLCIKTTLLENFSDKETPLQFETLNLLNQYIDFYHPHRAPTEAENLRTSYVLHILNHMLKTRSFILKHNLKLSTSSASSATIPDDFRDQGLARPKVLILLPFRKYAFEIVDSMAQLLFGKIEDKGKKASKLINYSRFVEDYTGDTLHFSKTKPKPEDYRNTFKGNVDDNFKIGISITKKSLKLYTDFNVSDIIIASPLGLRLGITSDSGESNNYDFLNSIEILVLDHVELFMAQNWENLLFVLEHLHLQPQSLQNVDLQRVRPWCLNGLCRFYRQSIILASHELPEMRALFHNKCFNYRGKAQVMSPLIQGDITNVFMNIPQIFHRIDVPKLESLYDIRFQYFVSEILPQYKKLSFAHCMIYVPSYFDFVRLRNYLKQETISFAQICEYTKKAKVARARDMFYHSGVHFLLYSERYHFFQRTRIKGIRHLIMYQPPMWPNFYSEMVNMMNDSNQNSEDGLSDAMSITVLYTKYDLIQLNAILGSESTAKLIDSGKMVHSFNIK